MSDTLSKALEDFKSIDGKIAALQKRRNELAQFIDLHQRLYPTRDIFDMGPDDSGNRLASTLAAATAEFDGTAKARIERAVSEILSDGAPRHTRVLLDELAKRGIEVGGQNKVIALSSILSRNKDTFEADRKVGWRLKKEMSEPAATGSDMV